MICMEKLYLAPGTVAMVWVMVTYSLYCCDWYRRELLLSWPGEVTVIAPFVNVQGLRDPVSKSPLMRRFPEDVQAVEEGATEVLLVVDVVRSKALVVATAVDEAAEVVLAIEYVGKEDSSPTEDGQLEIVEYCVTVDTSP
jgi:hypothetical protein